MQIIWLNDKQKISKRLFKNLLCQKSSSRYIYAFKNNSELEEINNYIYDLFESNEQLIHSIEHTERRLRDIQLKEIERQFQPHFLFNTMQTIQYLITLSPKLAQTVVQQLSQMLGGHENVHFLIDETSR